jgi:SAM-dependent methyltransferase/uncharacterized protein YbaR (Trm112 family)
VIAKGDLICIHCGAQLIESDQTWSAPGLSGEWPALACRQCGRLFPVRDGVPVVFGDEARTRAVVDPDQASMRVPEVASRMAAASELAGDDLHELRLGDPLQDSLAWEFYFWERWKNEDEGVVSFDRGKIDRFLERDREGGGRLAFLDEVERYAGGVEGKTLLNIGAGRDLLLERFLERGSFVVEVDVVLEPLVYLRERGAQLCVCCDARRLPFANDTFDFCTSFGSLHHIWPIQDAVSEMIRVTQGHVHLNEPNSFALTRLALRLPPLIRSRLKRWYSEGQSRSPYEDCISPNALRRAVKKSGGRIVRLSFPRSSWMSSDAGGLRRMVRYMNMAAVAVLPFTSSHFDAVIRRSRTAGGT